MMDIFKIMELLPHRYPFLLIDRILKISEEKIVGIKCVTMNEEFFQGHFPGHPIMPGVLIIESLAQTGAVFLLSRIEDPSIKLPYFAKIDRVKFRKPVRPGDVLRNECTLESVKGNVLTIIGKAYVEDKVVCEGIFTTVITDREG